MFLRPVHNQKQIQNYAITRETRSSETQKIFLEQYGCCSDRGWCIFRIISIEREKQRRARLPFPSLYVSKHRAHNGEYVTGDRVPTQTLVSAFSDTSLYGDHVTSICCARWYIIRAQVWQSSGGRWRRDTWKMLRKLIYWWCHGALCIFALQIHDRK